MDRAKLVALALTVVAALPLVVELRLGAALSALLDLLYAYIALAGGMWAWAFRLEIGRYFGRQDTPPIEVRLPSSEPTLSADKKHEILAEHRRSYACRVLTPLAQSEPRYGRASAPFSSGWEPWDDLAINYRPESQLSDPSDLEAFLPHLQWDIPEYQEKFSNLPTDAVRVTEAGTAWKKDLTEAVERNLSGFAPIEREGGVPSGPFVSLGSSTLRLARACRDIGLPQAGPKTPNASWNPVWPSATEVVPVSNPDSSNPNRWVSDGVLLCVPPAGVSVVEVQQRLADVLKTNPRLFREYARIRGEADVFRNDISQFRKRIGQIIAEVERGTYRTLLPCCKSQLELPDEVLDRGSRSSLAERSEQQLFSFTPREHKKGHLLLSKSRGLIAGSKSLDPSRTKQVFSNREASGAKGSQRWDGGLGRFKILDNLRWSDVNQDRWLFWAKFGVVTVEPLVSEVKECAVTSWFKTIHDPMGGSAEDQWIQAGAVSWYTQDARESFLRRRRLLRRLKSDPTGGLNLYLGSDRRPSISLGDYRDLQLFYTLNDDSRVFVTGGTVSRSAGRFSGSKKVKFLIRLRFVASNSPPVERVFECSARSDDFRIVPRG